MTAESEYLKTFRSVFEEANRAWNEGDMKRAYAALPEDVDYRLAPTWPSGRPLHGFDEVVDFFQDVRETFPDVRSEILELIQVDDHTVVAGSRVIGSGASSQVGTAMEIWQVWEMGEALVPFRVTEFLERTAALKAAGSGQVADRGTG
jgi:hypothetical protein